MSKRILSETETYLPFDDLRSIVQLRYDDIYDKLMNKLKERIGGE